MRRELEPILASISTMSNRSTERNQLVVTGSSAGGIEALSTVLGALAPDFPAPIVVAQHLDPRVPSGLANILAKRTQLNVITVTDTAVLQPGTVYVVPADRHVEITDGSVAVHADGNGRPKPSIDLLFASAAEVFGDRLTAVVLTGLGSDGSRGARAVKLHGGTVIIEDPQTASFPSMPASLEPAMVDVVAPLANLGAELSRIVNDSIDIPDDLPALSQLLDRVRSTSGIDFSHYKLPTIKRRLARQIAVAGSANLTDYLAHLDAEPAEFTRLVGNFLIKVTEFFRDREMFAMLRTTIVPEIIESARHRKIRELRFWSAGCSTGEEAYSLAILVAEALRDDSSIFNVRIFATDIDDAAISFARRGLYPADSVAGIEPDLLERYFTRIEGGWEVNKTIRNMTVFGQHDLAQRAPFPRIDLALCRNVLIYFSKELQVRTLQVFAFSLRDGGYLALGKAETASPLAQYFESVNLTLRIFRRSAQRAMIAPAQVERPQRGGRDIQRARVSSAVRDPSVREERLSINEKLGTFLMDSSIGVVMVDRRYDIVALNTAARQIFSIHGVALEEDFVHLMPARTATQMRALLDAALRNQQPAVGGEEIEVRNDGEDETRYVAISCYPELAEAEREVIGAVILAVDVSEIGRARHDLKRLADAQTRKMTHLQQAEAHARERQRSLVEANKQLADVNVDLRAQNDALVINAEESAAATEENETLNEEMQATNEELETLNEEFQATIEELTTTSDEQESRSADLQKQLTVRTTHEREARSSAAALAAIVDGLSVAVAAVDARGNILAANRLFQEATSASDATVQIDDEAGATIPLNVVLRRAGEGEVFTFIYRSIAADQALSVRAGRVRAVGSADGVQSIVELTMMSPKAVSAEPDPG